MKAIVLNNGYVSCIVYLGGSNKPIKAVARQWRSSASPYWREVVKACLTTGGGMRMRIDKIKGIWFSLYFILKCLFMHILFMQHEYKCKTCVV